MYVGIFNILLFINRRLKYHTIIIYFNVQLIYSDLANESFLWSADVWMQYF